MKMMSFDTTFQATDLVRRHRDVIKAARHAGALIRDKDGTTRLLTRAGVIARNNYLLELLVDSLGVRRALNTQKEARSASLYGSFAWITPLDDDDQALFLDELQEKLLESLGSESVEEIEELLAAWVATARIWADEGLRAELLRDIDEPLLGVEL
jgi:hypothetical protein